MHLGFNEIHKTGLLTNNTIIAIQQTLEENRAGFRTQLDTQLRNERTGQVMRKILTYNFCFVINKQLGNPPL